MTRKVVVLTLLCAWLGLSRPAAAEKGPVATCSLTEIQATNEGKGLDPRLKKLEAKLTRPPFAAWDTFRLLAEQGVSAEQNRPAVSGLATGGKLTLLLKDVTSSAGGKPRLRVGLDYDDKEGKRVLSTVMVFGVGEVHFPVAGQPHEKGVYLLALACTL